MKVAYLFVLLAVLLYCAPIEAGLKGRWRANGWNDGAPPIVELEEKGGGRLSGLIRTGTANFPLSIRYSNNVATYVENGVTTRVLFEIFPNATLHLGFSYSDYPTSFSCPCIVAQFWWPFIN
eukprot:TRINITY_DN1837_c0_g1_i2.p1 TRINITY_DN1837_c0_g1~~TRINITY_DN1837_c0_g1_i2.p1  ORF type:complete len:132 (-),score=15.33 TRINITY_DN1837_c0_g1_i2:76-441(-)